MKLIFVYNANAGFLDKIFNSAHKILSPSTYDCKLCALTFGIITEDELWKTYREQSEMPLEFYHKDEFEWHYKSSQCSNMEFPVILSENKGELEVFISSEELCELASSEGLIEEITRRLALR